MLLNSAPCVYQPVVKQFSAFSLRHLLKLCKVRSRELPLECSQKLARQAARNMTMEDSGFLAERRYLLHDRDSKYCPSFCQMIETGTVKTIPLPPRSWNLNAYAERWVRSVKEECLAKLILFGEGSLRHALRHYEAHYHEKRNHQGNANLLLFPLPIRAVSTKQREVRCRARFGGLLKYYEREAA